jgi:metal-responsive CopG/Arc/MetJ family transcriptional regulator
MSRHTRIGVVSKEPISRQRMLEKKILEGQQQKPESLISQLDIEIECPRCNEVLELSSDFDRISYFCESCTLQLRVG